MRKTQRGLLREHSIRLRSFEDRVQRVGYALNAALDNFLIVAFALGSDADHATRIDHEIECIEDSSGTQLLAMFLTGKLVIRRAANGLGAQVRYARIVEHCAHGARGEDVGFDGINFVGIHGAGRKGRNSL